MENVFVYLDRIEAQRLLVKFEQLVEVLVVVVVVAVAASEHCLLSSGTSDRCFGTRDSGPGREILRQDARESSPG